jgi:hypothetical protein
MYSKEKLARMYSVIDASSAPDEEKRRMKSMLGANDEQIKKEHAVIDELDRSDEEREE